MRMKKIAVIVASSLIFTGNMAMADSACLQTEETMVSNAKTDAFQYPIGSPSFEGFFHMYQLFIMAQQGDTFECNSYTLECTIQAPLSCDWDNPTDPYNAIWTAVVGPAWNKEIGYMSSTPPEYDPNLANGLPFLMCNYPQSQKIPRPEQCAIQYLR